MANASSTGSGPAVSFSASVSAFDKLEDEAECGSRAAIERLEPVDGADVGMIEGGERLGLAAEPRYPGRISRDVGRQDLDRHLAPEDGIGGPIDRAHAARPEQRFHPVRTELRADHDRRIILDQVGNRLGDGPIDHDRLIDSGQHRFHLTTQVLIVATGLADERHALGGLDEDSGLEHGAQALPAVAHKADLAQSPLWSSGKEARKRQHGASVECIVPQT